MNAKLNIRRAFTLVELLITMVIIAILSSLVLFALSGAANSAKEQRTKGTIAKINNHIMTKYESYTTRRVPLTVSGNRPAIAKLRLTGLREMMKMEMPDRYSDFGFANPTPTNKNDPQPAYYTGNDPDGTAYQLKKWSPIANTYWREAHAKNFAYKQVPGNTEDIMTQYSGAECMYLIVSHGCDADAMEDFSDTEIGDVDQDGMPEFIDGWGKPIAFLRWAPSYASSNLQIQDATNHHDPFDHMNQYTGAYALYPLIYSGGPDGAIGLRSKPDNTTPLKTSIDPFSTTDIGSGATNNKWGESVGTASGDDITSHNDLSP